MQSRGASKAMGRVFPAFFVGVLLLALIPFTADAGQGVEYRQALPGYRFAFPQDHYAHPDFKTEWWYFTGHLTAADGRRYGYELTFFRFGVDVKAAVKSPSAWAIRHLYFAHFAVSDLEGKRFYYADRLNRAALGRAGAAPDHLRVWNGDWSLEGDGEGVRLRAEDGPFALDLTLAAERAPVIHGADGISRKGAGRGQASHYYSLTRLRTRGTLTVSGRPEPVTGLSWMDHEFGSNQLPPDQVGWDWFGLQLKDGSDLMLYRIRLRGGEVDPHSSGTLVLADGESVHLPVGAVSVEITDRWTSAASGAEYPMGWRLRVPARDLDLRVTPSFPEQELDTRRSTRVIYWEGSVRVHGTARGRPIQGQGYVELTGYAHPFDKKI